MEHSGARSGTQSFPIPGGQSKANMPGGAATTASTISESAAHGKEVIGKATDEAVNSAGSDFQALRSDLNSLKDTVAKFVAQASSEAAKSAREITSSVAGQVGGAASDLAGKGAEIASAATDQAKSLASELENMARRNPLGAIAGAVVVGVLIGMMGRRS